MTARENGSASTLCRAGSWKWNFGLWTAAALWVFVLGESGRNARAALVRSDAALAGGPQREVSKVLRLETSREVAIVIVGIDDTDFEELTSPEEGHRAAARLIREASE